MDARRWSESSARLRRSAWKKDLGRDSSRQGNHSRWSEGSGQEGKRCLVSTGRQKQNWLRRQGKWRGDNERRLHAIFVFLPLPPPSASSCLLLLSPTPSASFRLLLLLPPSPASFSCLLSCLLLLLPLSPSSLLLSPSSSCSYSLLFCLLLQYVFSRS